MLHPNLIPILLLYTVYQSTPKTNLCKAAACTLPRSSSSQHITPVHKQLYRIILLLPFTSAHSTAPLYHTDLPDPFTPSCTLRAFLGLCPLYFSCPYVHHGTQSISEPTPPGYLDSDNCVHLQITFNGTSVQDGLPFKHNYFWMHFFVCFKFIFMRMFKILKFAWWPWKHWKMHLVKSEITSQNKLFSNLNLSLFFYSVIIKMVYRSFPEIRAWPQTVTKNSPFTRPKSDKKKFPVFVEFVTAV